MVTMLKNKCSVWKRIKFPTFWYNCYYFKWSDTYFIQLETLLINHPSYISRLKWIKSKNLLDTGAGAPKRDNYRIFSQNVYINSHYFYFISLYVGHFEEAIRQSRNRSIQTLLVTDDDDDDDDFM